jgi:hypothetical protein
MISQSGRLTWFDRSGNALGVVGPQGDFTDFRLTPDEKSLATSLVDTKTGSIDIWIDDLKRNNMSRFRAGDLGQFLLAADHDGTSSFCGLLGLRLGFVYSDVVVCMDRENHRFAPLVIWYCCHDRKPACAGRARGSGVIGATA